MVKIFIDGQEGTTGLRITERFDCRKDLEVVKIPERFRKDVQARRDYINAADIVFLCLPDAGAVEAVSLIENASVRVIDTSTAHRTANGWTYGFPELSALSRNAIATSPRVANPGCHASGFIAAVSPLVDAGLIDKNQTLSCFSLTGYSGGGKKKIAQYESDKPYAFNAPCIYALEQSHKHLKEMTAISGMAQPPVFCPIIDDFYSGMAVTVVVPGGAGVTLKAVDNALRAHYAESKIISVKSAAEYGGIISANTLTGKDSMQLCACGNDERITVTAVFDNLGKGASGAAIQNMNIMLGLDEAEGLVL